MYSELQLGSFACGTNLNLLSLLLLLFIFVGFILFYSF